MYFGRVYYANLDRIVNGNGTTITAPFALHFSPSSKKKNRRMFTSGYERYFIRDVSYMKIPNWNLLTVNYNGFKLARFYDKNVKSVLKNEIRKYVLSEIIKTGSRIKIKKIRKFVLKRFLNDYGSTLILDSFSDLINEKKLKLE